MIAELGHFTLILAAFTALIGAIVPMIGAQRGWAGWMAVSEPAAVAQFLLTAFSFAALMHAFITSDFSLRLVVENSSIEKPMIYKIAGVWGNHEGSMLLWVLILTLFGALCAVFGTDLPPTLKARVLAVQSLIGVSFFAFILLTSNPFVRLAVPPMQGLGQNPLLQDPGIAFHPPFLYLGYVGLSLSFSFAVAALIEGRVDASWGRWVRPWTLLSWMFLTIGIALGSYWAYYELGWGGFWFWDPVENASFMPWLVAAALLHCAIVVEKREALRSWTVLLAILAFGFSLVGTFIVRSGVITSVHAFASDPTRGKFILAMVAVFVGGALTLYAFRASDMKSKAVFSLVSRESGLILNNVLLTVAAFVVFTGTLWPLVAQMLFGRVLTVGAPFFDMAFTLFMVILAIVLPIGAVLPWKRGRIGRALGQVWGAGVLALAVLGLVLVLQTGHGVLAPIGIALAVWLVAGAAIDLWLRCGRGSIGERLARATRLPRADWGKALAHGGLGLSIMGICVVTAWSSEDIRVAKIGDQWSIGGYSVHLDDVQKVQGPNYVSNMADMSVWRDGRQVAELHPEKRFYPISRTPTTEAGIREGLFRDIYLVVGDPQKGGGWAVRSYIKPMAIWIWGGAMVMAFGGLLSLTDRRHRVAAGAAKQRRALGAVAAE